MRCRDGGASRQDVDPIRFGDCAVAGTRPRAVSYTGSEKMGSKSKDV